MIAIRYQLNSMFISALARWSDSSSWQRASWWPSSQRREHPLGMKPGVQSITPVAISQTPRKIIQRDLEKPSIKLLGKPIAMRLVAMETSVSICRNKWYCPSRPAWSVEWRRNMSNCWPRATAARSWVRPYLALEAIKSRTMEKEV